MWNGGKGFVRRRQLEPLHGGGDGEVENSRLDFVEMAVKLRAGMMVASYIVGTDGGVC